MEKMDGRDRGKKVPGEERNIKKKTTPQKTPHPQPQIQTYGGKQSPLTGPGRLTLKCEREARCAPSVCLYFFGIRLGRTPGGVTGKKERGVYSPRRKRKRKRLREQRAVLFKRIHRLTRRALSLSPEGEGNHGRCGGGTFTIHLHPYMTLLSGKSKPIPR